VVDVIAEGAVAIVSDGQPRSPLKYHLPASVTWLEWGT
jgi:hypothetical protein